VSTILISGISGFVGQNLLQYLSEKGENVHGVGRKAVGSAIKSWEQLFKASDAAECWIHLAGKAHDVQGVSDESAYEKANFLLTKQLFDAFLASEATTFIFMSSVKAAADEVTGVLDESVLAQPQTAYGKSKLKAEQYLLAQPLANKRLYILRPCMIHGPGNKGNLNLLYKFVKTGLPYPLAAFDNQRSFLSIENLCFIIYKLIHSEAPSGIYQLADDKAISTNALLGLIGESLGKKARLWALPKNWVTTIAGLGDRLSLPLNSDRLKKLTQSYVVNNQKIKTTLGINLPQTTEEGLKHTLKHFRHG